MGCTCNKANLDKDTEIKQDIISINQILPRNNENNNSNYIILKDGVESDKKEEEYMIKYSEYPSKIIGLINKIRQNPKDYADVIEDSIKNIIKEEGDISQEKPKIIYKQKLKVALIRGEEAFREAAQELRKMEPISPLEFKEEICIPLPDNIDDFKDGNFLRDKVKEILAKNITINVFFKELVKLPEVSALLMIVDDNGRNSGKKRKALLNKKFKYIGVTYRFIGKTFISYFAFSK